MEMEKVWLIFGVTGQDGSILCNYLLKKGYSNIHGVIRRSSNFNTQRLDKIFDKLHLHYGDLTDAMSTFNIIKTVEPDYIINFAAQSHVKVSSELENYTFQTNTIGVLNILQAVKSLNMTTTRIYQAGTSEEFGNTSDGSILLNEDSLKEPVSVYGVSKLAAENICNIYKNVYGMFIVCSTLFNHESTVRGGTFVTQKICNHIAKLDKNGPPLVLGNLYSKRDWGSAHDFIEAVYLMMTFSRPENFVIATGKTHSVKEFVELAYKHVNIDIIWEGQGVDEKGLDSITRQILIQVDEKYYRDFEIDCLIGDYSKAKKLLGWEPKTSFEQLVKEMINDKIVRKK